MNKCICQICNKEFSSTKKLSNHIRGKRGNEIIKGDVHNIEIKDYYDKYIKKENEGKCLKCKNNTNFISLGLGYFKCCSQSCNLSYNNKGKPKSKEHNKKVSIGVKRTHWSKSDKRDKICEIISKNRKGKKGSKESYEKTIQTRRERNNLKWDEERRKNYIPYNKDKTMEEIFGHNKAENIKNKIREKTKNYKLTPEQKKKHKDSLKKYRKSDRFKQDTISKSETLFFDKLEKIYNIKINRQFELNYKLYDGKYNNNLIEVDSEYWHSYPERKLNDKFKNQLAYQNKYNLYRFVVNRVSEVDKVIKENKDILNEIFN